MTQITSLPTNFKEIKGDLFKYTEGHANNIVIAHIVNDIGAWGSGFVVSLRNYFKKKNGACLCEKEYNEIFAAQQPLALGDVQFVAEQDNVAVANMCGQHNIRQITSIPPIRYDDLEICLMTVNEYCVENDCTLLMPKIGADRAMGDWEKIKEILGRTITVENVIFYYVPPSDKRRK